MSKLLKNNIIIKHEWLIVKQYNVFEYTERKTTHNWKWLETELQFLSEKIIVSRVNSSAHAAITKPFS